jgi:hypothetical protein
MQDYQTQWFLMWKNILPYFLNTVEQMSCGSNHRLIG